MHPIGDGFYGERPVGWFGWKPQQSHADPCDRLLDLDRAGGSDADALGAGAESDDGAGERGQDAAALIGASAG